MKGASWMKGRVFNGSLSLNLNLFTTGLFLGPMLLGTCPISELSLWMGNILCVFVHTEFHPHSRVAQWTLPGPHSSYWMNSHEWMKERPPHNDIMLSHWAPVLKAQLSRAVSQTERSGGGPGFAPLSVSIRADRSEAGRTKITGNHGVGVQCRLQVSYKSTPAGTQVG